MICSSHRELVSCFFSNARHLLGRHGEIHVSHKTGHPYDSWDLGRLASESSLLLIEKVGFHKEDYPGYHQKKGDGVNCNKPFKLDPCCTFKFQISEAWNVCTFKFQSPGDQE
jgi:25S rRNA (uracil2634-N3)-methyltransferase